MDFNWNPMAKDIISVKEWLAAWQPCVQKAEFQPARDLFAQNVVSFGTHIDVVEGLDALEENQWRNVWPTIEDFGWDFEQIRIGVSSDRLMSFLITTWTSTGFEKNNINFDRPGRTTVILARKRVDQPWFGIHTHFSLYPGTPQRSFGRR